MHARRSLVPLLSLACVLSGCLALKPLRTDSGSPEVIVRSATAPELIEGLEQAMARRGYKPLLANERVAVFSRPCEDFDTAFFYGKGWNASADFRVTFCLSQDPLGMEVRADLEIVTGTGTPEEAATPAPQGHEEAHALQDLLETLQADLALRRHEEQWPDEPRRSDRPVVWTGRADG